MSYGARKFIAIILLCITLTTALCLLTACTSPLTPSRRYEEIYDREDYSIECTTEHFRILKVNDLHLINGTSTKDKKTLAKLKAILGETEYDLIVLDGDVFEGYNSNPTFDKTNAARMVGEMISERGVPWTFAPGNNDGQKGGSNEDIIAFWLDYPYFLAGNVRDISGSMQFFIDITASGELRHSVAIMDSHSLDDDKNYDYIKENQISALLAGIEKRKVPVSIFFHMPTPAFKNAYTEGIAYEGFPFADPYAVDSIAANVLFDDMTRGNEYISLISVGHVHGNNMAYLYNNRYYQLSSLGGYGAVGANDTEPSYTLTTVNLNSDSVRDRYEFEKI